MAPWILRDNLTFRNISFRRPCILYRVLQPLKDGSGLLLCIFVKFSQDGRQLLDRIMSVTIFILALVTHALEPIQNLNFIFPN